MKARPRLIAVYYDLVTMRVLRELHLDPPHDTPAELRQLKQKGEGVVLISPQQDSRTLLRGLGIQEL